MGKLGDPAWRLDLGEAMRLYNKGYSDAEIASHCHTHLSTVREWRRRMDLPPNQKAKKRRLTKLEMDAIAANALGMTYGQYIAAGRPERV